ncbi:MAG: sigma-54 interaction domain-containing protein [Bacillota bacterium]|jgi:PAS domain S-box-containing protein
MELLEKLNKELQAIFDSSFDEIFVTDGEGYVTWVNKAGQGFYGVTEKEIIGKHVCDLEKQGFFSPSITMQVLDEKKRITSIQTVRGGQKLIVTANPVFNEEGKIIMVVANSRDLTELNNFKHRLEEAEKLMDVYRNEIFQLHKEKLTLEEMVYTSSAMKHILNIADKVSGVDSTVLIQGESGVGKGVMAARIHKLSRRCNGPFIKINCGAIPENLIESELFGYEAGAFTGAKREGKKGLIELASGGTTFFDEISELPLNLQVKLLHVIQDKSLMRVGGGQNVDVDIRIIAATNRDLKRMIKERKFREDLYYRLNVVPLVIPPLRQRKEDIAALVRYFMNAFNGKYGMCKKISPEALEVLESYSWPGNVREVENLIERLMVTVDNSEILPKHLPEYLNQEDTGGSKVAVLGICGLKEAAEEAERQLLRKAMIRYKNTYKMAEALDVNQSTIVRKLHRYGLLDEAKGALD